MNRTVYNHPDGFTLAFNDNVLTATDDDGKKVSLPIGPLGLVELAEELNAIGNDAGNLAEQAGGGIGIDCLNAILAAKTQGERVRAIQSAVLDLQRLPHPKRAAGGFSVALVNVLERGLGLCK
jgi:hypothetical protein